MYVLLNAYFEYEVEQPKAQVLVKGVTPDHLQEVLAEYTENGKGTSPEDLIKHLRIQGYSVIEVPIIEYYRWEPVSELKEV